MTAEIIPFPEEELWACCPICEGDAFHVIVDHNRKIVKLECADEDCQWSGKITQGE